MQIIYNTSMKNFIRVTVFVCCMMGALPCAADLFTSQDDHFTMDMPAGWTRVKDLPQGSVLSLQKKDARLDIKATECTTETCLDERINHDLAEVKAKQMTVLKNTYTDEEIKRIEFSTGEPFYYIQFYTPKNDFSAGYFLLNGHGYSVLTKNVTYAEADLIFAAISPVAQQTQVPPPASTVQDEIGEVDLLHAYDTHKMPDIEVADLEESAPATASTSTLAVTPASKVLSISPIKRVLRKLKIYWRRLPTHTLISANMPPYIRELGHVYDVFMLLLGVFAIAWCAAGFLRLFIRPKRPELAANPNSLYPIKLERLYGTPSMIFRAKDNQGNILTALASRWDSLLMFFGIIVMLVSLIVMAGTSLCEQLRLLALSAFVYNTIYAIASLSLPLGFLIFFCAIVWGQITMNEVSLFDRKGKKVAILLQKGYSLFEERYQLFFVNSKELLLAQRKRFGLRRQWTLMSKDKIEFASIKERSVKRALARMCCGHLWGFLRADYDITGVMDSHGVIENTHALFNKSLCNIDKPEAVNARDLLALSLLISIRDRDKWYPWFN